MTARVRGRIGGRRIDRSFSRRDRCAIADWNRAATLFAGALRGSAPAAGPSPAQAGADAVVVAVIGRGLSPYHWDFAAAHMPQSRNRHPSDDLPLERPPHEWLRGFPDPAGFAGYRSLGLTHAEDPQHSPAALRRSDYRVWDGVRRTEATEGDDSDELLAVHYYWLPGTKVIGALAFGRERIAADPESAGTGAASVAVGNLHGACPQCLLVFADVAGGDLGDVLLAHHWTLQQPWIDAVVYPADMGGRCLGVPHDVAELCGDRLLQRDASIRGQAVFVPAGDGPPEAFAFPRSTLLSSRAGPDWMVTVGANDAADASRPATGRPVDVSGPGADYPAASKAATVSGSGRFSGTANAAAVVAGIYGRALHAARSSLGGPSRIQADGVVAEGSFPRCQFRRLPCELRDGRLTAAELRARLMLGALHRHGPLGHGGVAAEVREEELLSEGHGTYDGLRFGIEHFMAQLALILNPLHGALAAPRPAGEREWFMVDSFCRQKIWGSWHDGDYVAGETELPGASPEWPVRSLLEATCSGLP